MKKTVCFLCLFTTTLHAQVWENFDDGDFANNPTWSGTLAKWAITNNQLQSNSTTKNDTIYLTTPSTLAKAVQWEFFVNLKFNTSGSNYTDIYLICDSSNLKSSAKQGYFVRIGGSSDEISLFRRKNGTNTKIIDGINSQTNTSNNTIKVKVTRNASNLWTLKRDLTGTGFNYVTEGTITDSTFNFSSYFGIFVKQSAASFHLKHFFDDISVMPIVIDTTAPKVISAKVISSTQVDVTFNEYVNFNTSTDSANYFVNNNLGNPLTALRNALDPKIVRLTFLNSFTDSLQNTITITDVEDFDNNNIDTVYMNFTYYAPVMPKFKDVIINEVFADPSPQVGLPNAEFIEIYNSSTKTFNIKNWQLGDATGASTITITDDTLFPNQYIIICNVIDTLLFKPFGRVIGMGSFPSLNNTGDNIYLIGSNLIKVDSVNYTDGWYRDNHKKEGGWSLELIHPKFNVNCPVSENWIASNNSIGGTPGIVNSVYDPNNTSPRLIKVNVISVDSILLSFNEAIDTTTLFNSSLYNINNSIGNPAHANKITTDTKNVLLTFASSLKEGIVYSIAVNSEIKDCTGKSIDTNNTASFIIPQAAEANDLVINEILPDPKIGGVDFVEIYNRSNKIIDLKSIFISQYDTINNIPLTKKIITDTTLLIYPKQYILLSENGNAIKSQYNTTNPNGFIDIKDLPTMNIASGAICISTHTTVLDYFKYDAQMHYPLLNETKGVSLERIDFNRSTNDRSNWHSASQTANFATPAYENSEYISTQPTQNNVELNHELFSPDEDGVQDVLTINYHFDKPGYLGNISIYDSKGRMTRNLVKSELLGTNGSYSWDGINENREKSSIGIYIIYFEAFDLSGNVKQFKKSCVLAGKL